MTAKLTEAIQRAEMLPDIKQDEVAEALLETVEAAERGVAGSSELAELGRQAWAAHQSGQTKPLDC